MATFNARWRAPVLIALVLAVAISFAAWRGGSAEAAGAPRLKAGDIVDAVLFNDGPAAKYLTGLRRGPTHWTGELRRIQDRIKSKVEADPAFAATFVARMQSGNPKYCATAMATIGRVVRNVLDETFGFEAVDIAVAKLDAAFGEQRLVDVMATAAVQNNEFSYDQGNDVWYVVDAVVAVSAVAVVAVVVVASAIDFTPREYSDRTMLAHEVMINHLATDLWVRG